MRRFVIGDIHGRYDELVEVLKRASFNYDEDELVSLGDIVDRGPEPFLCIFELQKIKNLIAIKGNHDIWLHSYMKGFQHFLNGSHGSGKTLIAYKHLTKQEIDNAEIFLQSQINYYIDKDNRFFVHGGFDNWHSVADNSVHYFAHDREFFESCLNLQSTKATKVPSIDDFSEIYIGHTPTIRYMNQKGLIVKASKDETNRVQTPINILNRGTMDTGAGAGSPGRLSLMNIETKELFQVDIN